jgi:hypothetical protein
MSLDRDPLRTLAVIALTGPSAAPIPALESVLAYAWDQLSQRRTDAEMAKLLNDLDVLDLLPQPIPAEFDAHKEH